MTDKVDMTKAVKGATVHFRSHGYAVVFNSLKSEIDTYILTFNAADIYFTLSYHDDGQCIGGINNTFNDIVKIDDTPFDWSMLKHGDLFKGKDNIEWNYIGKDRSGYFVFDGSHGRYAGFQYPHMEMIKVPE